MARVPPIEIANATYVCMIIIIVVDLVGASFVL